MGASGFGAGEVFIDFPSLAERYSDILQLLRRGLPAPDKGAPTDGRPYNFIKIGSQTNSLFFVYLGGADSESADSAVV